MTCIKVAGACTEGWVLVIFMFLNSCAEFHFPHFSLVFRGEVYRNCLSGEIWVGKGTGFYDIVPKWNILGLKGTMRGCDGGENSKKGKL